MRFKTEVFMNDELKTEVAYAIVARNQGLDAEYEFTVYERGTYNAPEFPLAKAVFTHLRDMQEELKTSVLKVGSSKKNAETFTDWLERLIKRKAEEIREESDTSLQVDVKIITKLTVLGPYIDDGYYHGEPRHRTTNAYQDVLAAENEFTVII